MVFLFENKSIYEKIRALICVKLGGHIVDKYIQKNKSSLIKYYI